MFKPGEIYSAIPQERKVVESSNSVKLVLSVKIFREKNRAKKFFRPEYPFDLSKQFE